MAKVQHNGRIYPNRMYTFYLYSEEAYDLIMDQFPTLKMDCDGVQAVDGEKAQEIRKALEDAGLKRGHIYNIDSVDFEYYETEENPFEICSRCHLSWKNCACDIPLDRQS